MIIDKNGRLFGKISIVDIFVIVIAIVVALGIYIRFSDNKGKAVVSSDEFYYTIEINNIRRQTYDAVMKSKGLHFYSCEKTEDDMGELIEVDASQGMLMVEKADGTAVDADVPGNYDLKLTFKIDGKINERGYYTTLMRAVNAGSGYTIKSKYSTVYGTVSSVWQE